MYFFQISVYLKFFSNFCIFFSNFNISINFNKFLTILFGSNKTFVPLTCSASHFLTTIFLLIVR